MLVWSGIVLLWVLSYRSVRGPLVGLVRVAFQPLIIVPIAVFVAYLAAWIWLAERAGLWNFGLINETVIWFLVSGLVLFGHFNRVFEQDDFFQRTVRQVLTWALVAEVFINLVVMPFWIEFLLVPVASLVVLLGVFVKGKEEFEPVEKLMDWLSALIGLGVFAFVVVSLLVDPSRLHPAFVARVLALPVLLTLFSLPFIYAVGLYAAYDKVFQYMNSLSQDREVAKQAKRALVKRLHLRARRVGAFDGRWQRRLLDGVQGNRTSGVISEFLQEQRQLAS